MRDDQLQPLSDGEKRQGAFDESQLKGELGWINRRETWYDTVLAIRYGKVEIARALEKPRYECMGVAVFSREKELFRISLEAYEQEKKEAIQAGRALFIRNPGTEVAAAAEQYLLDRFEDLVKGAALGRVNVLKLMDRGKYTGVGKMFNVPGMKE